MKFLKKKSFLNLKTGFFYNYFFDLVKILNKIIQFSRVSCVLLKKQGLLYSMCVCVQYVKYSYFKVSNKISKQLHNVILLCVRGEAECFLQQKRLTGEES